MYRIALLMLFGDRRRYLMLVSVISFATFLMAQQLGIFTGTMLWTTSILRNTQVPVWVMDPMVEQVNLVTSLRDTDLFRVRSVTGVKWAIPYYLSLQQARLPNGRFIIVSLTGLDASSLIGAPTKIIKGRLEDLWQTNAVMIDEVGIKRLSAEQEKPIGIGDSFEINDHEVRIVAICSGERSYFTYPYVYTTYERAIQIAPPIRKNLAYVLVEPLEGWSPNALAKEIERETGLKALSQKDFFWNTIWWFVNNSSITFALGIMVMLGFLIGIIVSGQTFYLFVLDNIGNLGTLKAMGSSNGLIYRMLVIQTLYVGFVGYGIGMGLTALYGFIALKKIPFYLPVQIMILVFIPIMVICITSAYLGIKCIRKLEPAEVFRV